MRRLAGTLLLVAAAACARQTWEGTRDLSHGVAAPTDSVLYAAARVLRAQGYEPRIVNGQVVVTMPHAVPQYVRPVSTNPELDGDTWVLQVQAEPNAMRSGSTLRLNAYIVPKAAGMPTDSVRQRNAIPVTSDRPDLMQELQRLGNAIIEATGGKTNP